jgi:endonuclease YncB( thermonuclease family)
MFLILKSLRPPPRTGTLFVAAACLAAGLAAGALMAPVDAGTGAATPAREEPASLATPVRHAYPAEVLRVIDGDTFAARVRVWPGLEVNTHVRLRGIDAPELHARCDDERAKAIAARDALRQILSAGAVGITRVGQDKYGGRVDADVSTASTADVSAAMLGRGLARPYFGGRRGSWCG